MRLGPMLLASVAALVISGCGQRTDASAAPVAERNRGASPQRGAQLIAQIGCGSCHTVPGIRGAQGKVAPPLDFFAKRTFIAGQLPNTPENLVRWLMDPPAVEAGTAMPNLNLDAGQARDIAAYLHTLE